MDNEEFIRAPEAASRIKRPVQMVHGWVRQNRVRIRTDDKGHRLVCWGDIKKCNDIAEDKKIRREADVPGGYPPPVEIGNMLRQRVARTVQLPEFLDDLLHAIKSNDIEYDSVEILFLKDGQVAKQGVFKGGSWRNWTVTKLDEVFTYGVDEFGKELQFRHFSLQRAIDKGEIELSAGEMQ